MRSVLIAAGISCAVMAPPAAAQTQAEDMNYAVISSVLGICTEAIEGGYNFNDVPALAVLGLAPAADEADLRSDAPALEAVRGRYPHGDILVAQALDGPCMVLISGSGRIAARDGLIAEFTKTGVRAERTSDAGNDVQTFYFKSATVVVQTESRGIVNIAVKRPDPEPMTPTAEFNLNTISAGAVFHICMGALDGTFDMNDRKELHDWGFIPSSASTESTLRVTLPGIEGADSTFTNGSIFVGFIPGTSCSVQIKGEGRIAARDTLIHQMVATGIEYEAGTSANGDEVLTFPYDKHPVYVFTSTAGVVVIQVH